MADNNLNATETAELFEKLNRLLNDNLVLMTDEQKSRKKSIEKQFDEIKALEKKIKQNKDEDNQLNQTLLSGSKYILQLGINAKANEENTKSVKRNSIALDEELALIKAKTKEDRKEIAEKQVAVDKARAIEDYKTKLAKMSADKTGTLLKGITEFGSFANKTFLDSTKGQGKYGDALDAGADKLMNLSVLFGPFGKAVAFAGAGLMKLAAMGLKHNEEMNKAYENLSEFGQVDASGIPQLFENLQNAGFVMKEMDKFQGVMKNASKDLAYLGDSAAEGQKAMTDLYGKTLNTQAEKTLKNLGYTNEQALKTYINYSGNLSRLGLMQGKTQAQVQKESLEYATTLDQLTKLTGVQRDELQERQRRAEQDIKYRIAMAKATPEMQNQIRLMSQMTAGGGEEFAAGVREMIANGGNAVSEAGIKLQLNTQGAASKIIKAFNRGEIDYFTASKQLADAMDKRDKQMRNATVISSEVATGFGQTYETMDWTNMMLTKSADARKKIEADANNQASGELDAQRRAETRRQISERNGEQAKDKLAQLVGKGISPAMEGLEIVVNALGKAMAGAVKLMTFGKVDLTGAYASSEDKIKEKEKELNETKLKLGRAQRSRNDVEAKKLQAQYDLIQQQLSALKGDNAASGGSSGGGGGGGSGAVVGDEKTKKILDYIGKVESGGNYNKLVGGKTADLTNMSVAQVMQFQKSMNKAHGFESSAVGKYQVIASTLEGVLKEAGVSATDKFDAATQDKIAIALMKRRGYDQYQRGTMSKGQFANNLASEWASMPTSSGRSAYHGVGSNRSLVARADFENVLSLAKGGLASGPVTGYPAILHGTEMVIPMENTKDLSQVKSTPLVAPTDLPKSGKVNLPDTAEKLASDDNSVNSIAKGLKTEFETLTTYLRTMSQPATTPQPIDSKLIADTISSKLDSVIEHLRRAANTQEELLQHSRN